MQAYFRFFFASCQALCLPALEPPVTEFHAGRFGRCNSPRRQSDSLLECRRAVAQFTQGGLNESRGSADGHEDCREGAATSRRFSENMEAASRAGAKLVVFPECALTGYCFTSRDEAWPLAETVPGPSTEKLAAAREVARLHGHCGHARARGRYDLQFRRGVDPQGMLGTYRKVHLLCLGIDRYNALGDKPFPVFETPHGKIGINICYDCSFPESGRVVKLQRRASARHSHQLAARLGLLAAHAQGARHGESPARDRRGPRGRRARLPVLPAIRRLWTLRGSVLAEAGETEETILYAELDIAAADQQPRGARAGRMGVRSHGRAPPGDVQVSD